MAGCACVYDTVCEIRWCMTQASVASTNPGRLTDDLSFEVRFECLEPLQDFLQWKLVYVGSAEDKTHDQELDVIELGPVQRGTMKFIFTAAAPNFQKLPVDEIQGITVVLLTGSYRGQEFIRIGWYVENLFVDAEGVRGIIPPSEYGHFEEEVQRKFLLSNMTRYILSDAPRVTRFNIDWEMPSSTSA
eukprot:GHVO01064067.1.p1 GENE.GHVO01064067.1~~GHVO01064067.1.p1  ORF type:complete len:188 (+),score=31.42 GHVO01064067.1:40-603(+)